METSRDECDYWLLQSDSGTMGSYRVRRVYPSILRKPTLLRKNAFADVAVVVSVFLVSQERWHSSRRP
jgi:hypothetical protein